MGNEKINSFKATPGMTVQTMLKKGNKTQQKIAFVFDANRNGKYEANEAALFNNTSVRKDGYYDRYEFSTKLKDGNTDLNYMYSDEFNKYVLSLNKENNVEKQKNEFRTNYYMAEDETLVKTYNNGSKTYQRNYQGVNADDGKKVSKTFTSTYNIYNRPIETQEPIEVGEHQEYVGYTHLNGNVTKYYRGNDQLAGSVVHTAEGDSIKNDKNQLLYVRNGNTLTAPNGTKYEFIFDNFGQVETTITDKNGKEIGSKKGEFLQDGGCSSELDQFTPIEDQVERICYTDSDDE